MIPKIIHYCWFGGNEKPAVIKKCMESWRKYCPDYEIIEWNESNFDVNMFEFTKSAYKNKKWAFVSDVARLWAVYNYGGIYFDTDVELLNKIDNYLKYDAFMCFTCEIYIASGLGFGSSKKNPVFKKMLQAYGERSFIKSNGKIDNLTCPRFDTPIIEREIPELQLTGKDQVVNNIAFLSCGTCNKYLYHYGTQTWTDRPNLTIHKSKKQWKDTALKRFLRKPSRIAFVKKHCNNKLYELYIFLAYDLQEYGFKFFINKIFNKLT